MTEILHIYSRVSSSSQEEEGTGLDEQRESRIQRSKELGFEFEIHNEGSQSSFNDGLTNREVLISLLDQIEEEIKETAKVSTKELEIKAAALFEKFVSSLSKT